MAKRSYEQYCPLACALDLVGERWTLLIVRELLGGPRRYTDLQRGLPGLATDLLTERLRRLEEAGVLQRRELAPPAAATVYELTDRGRELEPAVFALAGFGVGLLRRISPSEATPNSENLALLLRVLFDPDRAPAQPETWIFEGGGPGVGVTVDESGAHVHPDVHDLPGEPSARFAAEVPTILELLLGKLDTAAALTDGRLKVEGDADALVRLRAAFPAPAGAYS